MRKENLRNIAIIAHVDHGKTTLVDGMLKQSGTFRDNQVVEDRIMDSMDLEKERGITIMAKNTSIFYNDVKINIVDTPGHADFGGEVERSLNLVDGALILVDASEGPLPQTRFVVKKALAKKLPIILVINKIDRPDARIQQVINEVYDLFIDLDAQDEQIEFKILYTNAKTGVAHNEIGDNSEDLKPLFDAIISEIPGPDADDNEVPQFLVTNLDYDSYVGQIAIGRLSHGILEMNKTYSLVVEDKTITGIKFSALFNFQGLKKKQVTQVEAGDIIALAGVENLEIGDTITSNENPKPLPRIKVDEPTLSMIFYVNDSPFAGREGKFLTTRHLKERLERETLRNVAIELKYLDRTDAFEVCGRGELQMAVLIETIRREGYEFLVSKPQVITKDIDGKLCEPVELLLLDIPEEHIGILTSKLSVRKGVMANITNSGSGRVNMEFRIPSRGLIGFRSQFLTDTKGAGVMNTLFDGYEPWYGPIPQRSSGALVADRQGRATANAAYGMEDRGELFIEPGYEVYPGMIVGERNKTQDLIVNITKEKKLTNMRASNSDATVVLRPCRKLSLDQCIEFIAEDELIEITPENIRLRKMELDPNRRRNKKE
ncbi:MAG: GTP-binding protein TypA [Ignavibacteria bacterium GWB2_35_12]|nr:MAG: GTP-binding protein TypA [Ignavibacteria bacterium GWA2_35_8]OGU40847.1 MAG: GTP-binding protein TypA [Ignavibacteria bacterium GWB2_35_12]OGU87139.1 MAG: GTP-binding protein TypA [Ignavibacteria bacterium RIFOXYA2_FULL_35_10]OGV24674.1 MAG: GTP-binding protein TypA [Ignavibacteria bacterium RIFOXYC2_FULL_35_21]